MTGKLLCWCGAHDLEPFSEHYLRCNQCSTLVSTFRKSGDFYKGSDDIDSLYGREYWTRHVKESYGFPDIFERARNDLAERDIYWLRAFLKYKLPPAKTLELGCAHGGSVFLMQLAGFSAEGSEMSPWLCQFASETFGIPMHCGTVEDASIESESVDSVIMMDVLEHMPNPVQSLQEISKLLKKDGIVVIQAPWWRSTENTYEEMTLVDEKFLLHLKEEEHLFLYSQMSIVKLLNNVGFNCIKFEKAIFPHDMFVFASKTELTEYSEASITNNLIKSSNGRIALALIDTYNKLERIKSNYDSLNKKYCELHEDNESKRTGITSNAACEIVQKYENSISWKMTKPLRYIHSKLVKYITLK